MFQFKRTQKLSVGLEELWEFISDPKNLSKITPEGMGFQVMTEVQSPMYEGQIIGYKVSPLLGIEMTWVTEITHVKENEYFVDEQRIGPYKLWHHEHLLKKIEGGVEMVDIVSYVPPFMIFGRIANFLFIRKKLESIFNYRNKVLKAMFGELQ